LDSTSNKDKHNRAGDGSTPFIVGIWLASIIPAAGAIALSVQVS